MNLLAVLYKFKEIPRFSPSSFSDTNDMKKHLSECLSAFSVIFALRRVILLRSDVIFASRVLAANIISLMHSINITFTK